MMTDKEYYSDTKYLTNSMLGWFDSGINYYNEQLANVGQEKDEDDVPDYLKFGNAVHCILLEKKEFSKRYFIHTQQGPSNAVQKKYCALLASNKRITNKSLETAYKLSYSTGKLKNEEILNKSKELYDKWKEYISEQRRSENKISLSKSQYDKIKRIENNVALNKAATKLLKNTNDIHNFNENIIFYIFHEVDCKSKLDRYTIDIKNKKITVVEVKTLSVRSERDNISKSFKSHILDYNYDRQFHMYMAAIHSFFKENYPDEEISQYEIKMKVIAIKSNFDNEVRVFDIDKTYLENGENKFNYLIKRYKHYKETGNDYDLNSNGEEVLCLK